MWHFMAFTASSVFASDQSVLNAIRQHTCFGQISFEKKAGLAYFVASACDPHGSQRMAQSRSPFSRPVRMSWIWVKFLTVASLTGSMPASIILYLTTMSAVAALIVPIFLPLKSLTALMSEGRFIGTTMAEDSMAEPETILIGVPLVTIPMEGLEPRYPTCIAFVISAEPISPDPENNTGFTSSPSSLKNPCSRATNSWA